jgi:hypothetical protein
LRIAALLVREHCDEYVNGQARFVALEGVA